LKTPHVAALLLAFLCSLAHPVAVRSQEACPDHADWPLVFQHICEFPRVHRILVGHPVRSRAAMIDLGTQLLGMVGDYRFTEACLRFELVESPGGGEVQELLILDGAQPLSAADVPRPLLRVRCQGDTLRVTMPDGSLKAYHSDRQATLDLHVLDGRVQLSRHEYTRSGANADTTTRFEIEMAAPQGVLLAVPCRGGGCLGCEPFALWIALPAAAARHWPANVAQALCDNSGGRLHGEVLDEDDWSTIADRIYGFRSLALLAAASDPEAGVAPRPGSEVALAGPRILLANEELLARQCGAVETFLRGRMELKWLHASLPDGETGAGTKRHVGNLTDRNAMAKASRLFGAAADSFDACQGSGYSMPLLAIHRLRLAQALLGAAGAAAGDTETDDLRLAHTHVGAAWRYLLLWARGGFR
jgi:hypothetical protein